MTSRIKSAHYLLPRTTPNEESHIMIKSIQKSRQSATTIVGRNNGRTSRVMRDCLECMIQNEHGAIMAGKIEYEHPQYGAGTAANKSNE